MTGSSLRAIRHRLGVSQAKLAVMLGTSQSFIGEMELDRKPILPDMEARIRALVPAPNGLCGRCLIPVVSGICGCPAMEAA